MTARRALMTRLAAAMRARRSSPIMAAALAALTVLTLSTGLYAASAFFSAGYAPQLVKSEWRPPSLAAFEPLAPKPPAADKQTLERPLFEKSRRPPPAKVSSAADEKAPEPVAAGASGLSLAGIVRCGARSRAFVSGNNGADGEWYEVGQKISGWTIAKIRRIDLTLTSGDRAAELKLYPDPSAAPAAAPPPPPPAPPIPPLTPIPRSRDRG